MPALMILGYDMDLVRVMLVASLGGLLGILMMIPLRRAFIVKQHGTLTYPEGTACAKVLIVGEQGGSSAKTVFAGFGLAFVYQVLMQGLKLWQEYPAQAIAGFKAAVIVARGEPDPDGRRLHHRLPDRVRDGRRGRAGGPGARAGHRPLRRRTRRRRSSRAPS